MPFSIILYVVSILKLERNGEHVGGDVKETGSKSLPTTATLKESEETTDRVENTERDSDPPAKRRKTSNYTFVSTCIAL